jgi:o-succinylbenzoate synthase
MNGAIYGNTSSKAAADMAIYDLSAKVLGVPEYKLLGGACRKTVGVNRHIGINAVAEAVRLARSYTAQGYKTIKIKVGNDADEDIRRIKAIRQAVGESINLRIDANQGYTFPAALRVLNALRDDRLEYCEQPLPAWDVAGLKKLRESTGVPIGADESLHSVQDAITMAENRSVDVFVLKLIKTGGIWPALQIAGIAEAVGIKCVITSPFDTQIGAAHCLHLAAALPAASISCDLTCYASQPEMATTCHIMENGMLDVGADSGCGVSSICEL